MALSILDGNQSATTLSTIVTSGQHIPAHTVVSIGTQAITDISGAISGSTVCVGNLGLLQSTVATEGLSASGSFIKIGGHTGTSTTGNIVHVSAVGALRVDGSVYTQPVSIASVTIGNTVTIAGTVTANPTGTQTIAGTVTANVFGKSVNSSTNYQIPIIGYDEDITAASDQYVVPVQISSLNGSVGSSNPLPISGTVTANIPLVNIQPIVTTGLGVILLTDEGKSVFDNSSAIPATLTSAIPAGTNRIGVVTIGGGTVTIGAGTAQIGSVTASISNSVTIASLPAISGTVTANSSNGSLTTRFGSVTTANTAFATSAVTNSSRKYLLIQNVTTASNVITVGVGFTPTTTQGIQLTAGAGLTFEGSYIPTGAVNLLSSVTASCFTILEA